MCSLDFVLLRPLVCVCLRERERERERMCVLGAPSDFALLRLQVCGNE
jgi:hypothetical protein